MFAMLPTPGKSIPSFNFGKISPRVHLAPSFRKLDPVNNLKLPAQPQGEESFASRLSANGRAGPVNEPQKLLKNQETILIE